MRLGDFISVEDWDSIMGEPKRAERPSMIERLTIWLIVIGVGVGLGFVQGCDGQAAEITAKAEEAAHEKKLELLSHPLTWTATVTQCDTVNGCRTRYYLPSTERK